MQSTLPRKLNSLTDAIDLYVNPSMASLRPDRALWMSRHYPLVQKYLARVRTVAAECPQCDNVLKQRLAKLSITFEDLTKD